MGERARCPGCGTETSNVLSAFRADKACPHCGLSAGAAHEVDLARLQYRETAAADALEEALLRAVRAEEHAAELEQKLQEIGWKVEELKGLVGDGSHR